MSTLKVEVVRVEQITPHPNADRLELASIKGWVCVVGKGSYKPGDLGVYFPIDSVLPDDLLAVIFKDSKIKPTNRIRTIKIRGAYSQGLLVEPSELNIPAKHTFESCNLTDYLKVTKYEPPESRTPQRGLQAGKKQTNPHFSKYTDIENWKNYPHLFQPGEEVWVLEKIHGSNFRAGWVKFHATTWWKSLKVWLGIAPKYEFVFGSHNVQLQDKPTGTNIYLEMVEKYNLRKVLQPGVVVYGEVYGEGVQNGYMYDCLPGERKLRIFDIKCETKYADHQFVLSYCADRGLLTCPTDLRHIYVEDHIKSFVTAPSNLTSKHIREGIVIKPVVEEHCWMGRKILKWKSDEFLLGEDDTH